MSRRSKFATFFKAMQEVLNDPRSVILTDRELWVLTNKRLEPKDRVAESTFEFWKSPSKNRRSPENQKDVTEEMVAEFRLALDFARADQKMNLTGAMLDEENKNQWGASWILERKFKDLKQNKGLALGDGGNTQINITVGNPEHKGLVEDILSGKDIIDVDHEEIKENPKSINE